MIPKNLQPKTNGVQNETVHELFVTDQDKHKLLEEAKALPEVEISKLDLQWVQVLSEGWASPLKGFMRESQYLQTLHFNCLFDGQVNNQSVPIVLPINTDQKDAIEKGAGVVLKHEKVTVALMKNVDIFPHRKEERICRQFGTCHQNHPYIKVV